MTNETENLHPNQKLIWITVCVAAIVIAIIAMAIIIPSTIHNNDRLTQIVDMLSENIQQGEGGTFYFQADKSSQLSRAQDMAKGWFVNKNLKEDVNQLTLEYEWIELQDKIHQKTNENQFKTAYQMTQELKSIASLIRDTTYDKVADSIYPTIQALAMELSYFERVEKRMYELMNEKGVMDSYHEINDIDDNDQNFGICGYVTVDRVKPYEFLDIERVVFQIETPTNQWVSYGNYSLDSSLASKIEQAEREGKKVYAAMVFYKGDGGFYSTSYVADTTLSPTEYKDYSQTWLQDIKRGNANLKPTPSATPSSTPSSGSINYRVRKSADDASSQIGAYKELANAKQAADGKKNEGYKVFDINGTLIYDPKVN